MGMSSEATLRYILRGEVKNAGAASARALAAQFLVDMPDYIEEMSVEEFLCCLGRTFTSERVEAFTEAASIAKGCRLSDLSVPQRAALAGALRLRRSGVY
jgi:hypothetical protein